ncbi:MAG: prepilin-type N-terminal cleavage/methylation domain-containing protein [bacterium]|jgi:prepilin-type N-terminal cleavage/methylation domain-containing protein
MTPLTATTAMPARRCAGTEPARTPGALKVRTRAGFSLVEVLFAVLILGIALLGIGAMFPAVIREQRLANDSTFGVLVARGAEDYVRGHARFGQDFWNYWATLGQATWGNLSDDASLLQDDATWLPVTVDADTGAAILGEVNRGVSPQDDFRVRVPLADRLYPTAPGGGGSAVASDLAGPSFVWDLAIRRQTALPARTGTAPDKPITRQMNTLQVAVFVRRVDSGVRPPRGQSLYSAMLNAGLGASDRRLPVAEDARGPRLDGTFEGARYSRPMVMGVSFDSSLPSRDRLVLLSSAIASDIPDDQLRSIAAASNQVLVDNLGNVYTVIGVDSRVSQNSGPLSVRISPPVPASVVAGGITQVVFTLQPPAAVRVFTVNQ